MTPNITIQESLIYLMVTMSAVDRHMDDKELARIGRLVQFLPVFDQFDEADILPAAQTCHELLSEPSADHDVKVEEIRLLQLLRDRFGLDKLTCAALERSAIARYRNAGV